MGQAVDGENMQIRVGTGFQVTRPHIVLQDITASTAESDQQRAPLRYALLGLPRDQRGFAAAGHPFDQQSAIRVFVKEKGNAYHVENK